MCTKKRFFTLYSRNAGNLVTILGRSPSSLYHRLPSMRRRRVNVFCAASDRDGTSRSARTTLSSRTLSQKLIDRKRVERRTAIV